jgi:hypothetical protein
VILWIGKQGYQPSPAAFRHVAPSSQPAPNGDPMADDTDVVARADPRISALRARSHAGGSPTSPPRQPCWSRRARCRRYRRDPGSAVPKRALLDELNRADIATLAKLFGSPSAPSECQWRSLRSPWARLNVEAQPQRAWASKGYPVEARRCRGVATAGAGLGFVRLSNSSAA